MKKWLVNVIIAIVSLAIICVVFWKINWISSWKEAAILYGIMAVVIAISTLFTVVTTRIRNRF